MSFWIEHDAEGLVLAAYSGPGEQRALCGGELAEVEGPCDPGQCLFLDGGLVDLGPAPSHHYVRDPATRSWVLADDADPWEPVRARREQLLADSDWVALRALEQGQSVPAGWVAYRQALRDITLQPDPLNLTWPTAPW